MVIDAPLFVFFATEATDRRSKNSYCGSNAAVDSKPWKPNICFTVGVREEAVSKSRGSFRFSHPFNIRLALGCGLRIATSLSLDQKLWMGSVVSRKIAFTTSSVELPANAT